MGNKTNKQNQTFSTNQINSSLLSTTDISSGISVQLSEDKLDEKCAFDNNKSKKELMRGFVPDNLTNKQPSEIRIFLSSTFKGIFTPFKIKLTVTISFNRLSN